MVERTTHQIQLSSNYRTLAWLGSVGGSPTSVDPKSWRVVKIIEKTVAEHSVQFDMALLVTDIFDREFPVKNRNVHTPLNNSAMD